MKIPGKVKDLIKGRNDVSLKYAGKWGGYDAYKLEYHMLEDGGYPCVGYPQAIFSNDKETRWATVNEAIDFYGLAIYTIDGPTATN